MVHTQHGFPDRRRAHAIGRPIDSGGATGRRFSRTLFGSRHELHIRSSVCTLTQSHAFGLED